ncbi:MAG: thioredoxin-disulfide reductase [Candidatus Woesearchaeota archaeon]
MEKHDIIILGDGVSGLSAAIYAARADLKPLLITGYESGGQLMLTTEVENYPGFPEGIMGPELIENMRKQAERFGTKILYKRAESISGSQDDYVIDLEDEKISTKSIIIATGASARTLKLDAEKTYFGKGISTCATCDGAFTKGKKVIVVGGGDSAMEESLFLSKFADSVTIVHRKDVFRASKIMQQRVFDNPKIQIIWNHEVMDIMGDNNRVSKALLKNTIDNTTVEEDTDFVFYAIGHDPNVKFLNGMVELNEHGYIITDDMQRTSREGIFAAGDVQDHIWRQAVTAAGTGAAAAISAERYLSHKNG